MRKAIASIFKDKSDLEDGYATAAAQQEQQAGFGKGNILFLSDEISTELKNKPTKSKSKSKPKPKLQDATMVTIQSLRSKSSTGNDTTAIKNLKNKSTTKSVKYSTATTSVAATKKFSTISVFADGTLVVHPSTVNTGRSYKLNRLLSRKSSVKAKPAAGAGITGKERRISTTSLRPSRFGTSRTSTSSILSATAAIKAWTEASTKLLTMGKSKSTTTVGMALVGSTLQIQKKKLKTGDSGVAALVTAGTSKSETKISTTTIPSMMNTTEEEEGVVQSYNVAGYKVSPPSLVLRPTMWDISLYLTRIQNYFHILGYQRQGEPKIIINTHTSIRTLNETAKKLIKAGEQIKCLHALVLAIHFTNCSPLIERFPINFKSFHNGKAYKHVVLGIYMFGRFGALGLSRDITLQSKPVDFRTLQELLANYCRSYTQSGHILIENRVGGAITHDPHSLGTIQWKVGPSIDFRKTADAIQMDIKRISKLLRSQMSQICLKKTLPSIYTINPTTMTKEFILEHTSVQLRCIAPSSTATATAAASAKGKKRSKSTAASSTTKSTDPLRHNPVTGSFDKATISAQRSTSKSIKLSIGKAPAIANAATTATSKTSITITGGKSVKKKSGIKST